MKHLLNDMTEAEKNSIREQHKGGIKVNTEKFAKLVESKLGESKPYLIEQSSTMVKIYDDEGETKFLDTVTISGEPKKTGFDKSNLEFSASVVGKNNKGILRIQCSVKPRKFYFHENGKNITLSGFSGKMADKFCSSLSTPMS